MPETTTITTEGGLLHWSPGGVTLTLSLDEDRPVRLESLRPATASAVDASERSGVPLVEVDCLGQGRVGDSAGAQHRPYAVAASLRYTSHTEQIDGDLSRLVVEQGSVAHGLLVTTRLEVYSGTSVVRSTTEVRNVGDEDCTLTYVSSLALGGFRAGLGDQVRIHEARNSWIAELRWQELTPEQAGVVGVRPLREGHGSTRGRHPVTARGSWSTADYLAMGAVESREESVTWAWQIEHQGAWHWEVGDLREELYLLVSGPTDHEHQWRERLAPGSSFTSVPVAVAVAEGGLPDALRSLNAYRRRLRRPSADNVALPVIFNDYMNCLMGDPTEERLEPLIAAAAEVGAEYFVIDAGWYADDGGWWETVGAWEPSRQRFPSGLGATIRRITDAGMKPGLWLEPEVVGVRSEVVDTLPEEAFFTREGVRVRENGRFHLDFRCAAVRERMDAVVDRLVDEFGIRYFKLDYNIDLDPGTDALAEAPGAGLLGHERAYLAWLDGVLDRHPGLVLENCSSGAMRMDYAMLSRLSLQSTSDQRDHYTYAVIAAAAPSAVTPEQGAVWAYPQPEHDAEEASFALVNALLGRVHLSGRIDLMDDEQRKRVSDAMAAYKTHRSLLAAGQPYWPLGLPGWYDPQLALAVATQDECLVAVWHRGNDAAEVQLPLPALGDGDWRAETVFPGDLPTDLAWDADAGALRVGLPAGPAARLVRLTPR